MTDNVKGAEAQRPDELFDIVDAEDQVIGQATRAEAHARGLWHRAIHVWVFNAAGDLFLQKRSHLKDTAPGKWDSSCSGHVDAGEDYDVAAERELGEEIGLYLGHSPERWRYLSACRETGWEFVRVYRCRSEGPFMLHPAEIETGRWWTIAELTEGMRAQPDQFTRPLRYVWGLWIGEAE